VTAACAGCGLPIEGGTAGCRAIFDALLARDFGEVAYFRLHRLLVDAYSLQHPEDYCASAKSFAAHATGLCWALERAGDRAVGSEALRRWLDGPAPVEKPTLPPSRGARTIADVRAAADVAAYEVALERWARSTWDAYTPLHALVRGWVERALASPPRRR
jgi:hypothetical protein